MARQNSVFSKLRVIAFYGACLAAGAFVLDLAEYQYTVRRFSTEMYIVLIALGFTAVGIWLGRRLNVPAGADAFERNEKAIATLGLTPREVEVLESIASGASNREVAGQLSVSESTIKTHLIHLYQKLDVPRRTQAISKARSLKIIP